jgi:hypothetical protein
MGFEQVVLKPDSKPVVAKAFYNAADVLNLNRQEIRDLLGVSEPTISRHRSDLDAKNAIRFDEKRTELALLFIRVYRSLLALLGGDEENARKWFDASNAYLGATPRKQIQTIGGLVDVIQYLDAMRGKI